MAQLGINMDKMCVGYMPRRLQGEGKTGESVT